MKIIIPTISHKIYPVVLAENAARETWLAQEKENVTQFFYYGWDGDPLYLPKEKELYVTSRDGPLINKDKKPSGNNVIYKTIEMFKYVLNHFEFDFLVRPTSTTYVHIDRMYDYLLKQTPKKFYGGHFGPGPRIWATGASLVFSRDVIEFIISNIHYGSQVQEYTKCPVKPCGQDDKWIGQFLDYYKFIDEPHYLNIGFGRLDLDFVTYKNIDHHIKKAVSQEHFLYKCGITARFKSLEKDIKYSTCSSQKIRMLHNEFIKQSS